MANLPGDGEVQLRLIWQELRAGTLQILAASSTAEAHRLRFAQRAVAVASTVSSADLDLLERGLAGGRYQTIAIELGVSPSTVFQKAKHCLKWMGSDLKLSRQSPLLAFTARASFSDSEARVSVATRAEGIELTLSRPEAALVDIIHPSILAVLKLYVEGFGIGEISRKRKTAARVVGNQLVGAFRTLGVNGRGELLARLFNQTFPASG